MGVQAHDGDDDSDDKKLENEWQLMKGRGRVIQCLRLDQMQHQLLIGAR